ncbi:flagellar export chaperone FliS [Oxalobacteraceae bacterium OTU3REALA1]|nr:flagellar export chaperone FliS [Oxalobacteraceae bacterium OTU3CAMAD1]USX22227.1 flagellar export chaperone FliS [Oxalobacteraceae bacterium OTU3REALA1]
MFGSRQTGVHAYAKVGMETGVVAASPHKLIVMLFDGALVALNTALNGIRSGNIAEKGKSISKAIMIIDSGLRAALDKKAGGEIAEGLDSLYEYMSGRLLTANINNDPAIVEEVQRLLIELRDAWNAIADTPAVTGIKQPNLASA